MAEIQQFLELLSGTQSPQNEIRQQAEAKLVAMEQTNAPQKMDLLAKVLANEQLTGMQVVMRQSAGLQLKNMLDAKDFATKELKSQRWLAVPPAQAGVIKESVLATLGSTELKAAKAAAQVVASIALIELPMQRWPGVIEGLQDNVTAPTSSENLQISSLESIGYVCEEVPFEVLGAQSNKVLTAVIQGMRNDSPLKVRTAGTKALSNAIIFIENNFRQPEERTFIMSTVCAACTESGSTQDSLYLKQAAFETLVDIAAHYHEHLTEYMQKLSEITMVAIEQSTPELESISRMAIEFWCTICDEEIELYDEMVSSGQPSRHNPQFIKAVHQHLVSLLLQKLLQVDEDDDDDDNIATSAGTCLTMIAQTVKDDAVPGVLEFVQGNIQSPDWRGQSAAVLAFGFILDGPTPEKLVQYLNSMTPMILMFLNQAEPTPQQFPGNEDGFDAAQRALYKVKYAAAWTLSRMAEFHGQCLESHLDNLMQTLVGCLMLAPGVANNACWALHFIAAEFGEQDASDGNARPTNPISKYFQGIMMRLFEVTTRGDAGEDNLRISAYEVINGVIASGADDTVPLTEQLIANVLQRIESTFTMQDVQTRNELQGLLCGVSQSITTRLGNKVAPYSDAMMQCFLKVIQADSATVHEEALMAVSAIAVALGSGFKKYVESVAPVLKMGLDNSQEYEVCNVAVGLVGDLCRALEKDFMRYADPIVESLLTNLQNVHLDNMVKPPILAVFGDLAMAVGGAFERYLQPVAMMLQTAATYQPADLNDEMEVEYMNEIRESVLDAYVGILHGLHGDQKIHLINPQYLKEWFRFLVVIASDHTREVGVTRVAIALVGDLAALHGQECRPLFQMAAAHIVQLIRSGVELDLEEAQYAKQKLEPLGVHVPG